MNAYPRVCSLLVGSCLTLAACGVPLDEQAEVIDPGLVEYGLLQTTTSAVATTEAISPTQVVNFYWHNAADNRLVVIQKGREVQQQPGEVLIDLVAGPLEADLEANPNLQTLLDPIMEPTIMGPSENGVHQIQINQLAEVALTTAQAAELVCTAVQFEGIDRIEIIDLEGTKFSLSGNGAVVLTEPAQATDFGNCEPAPLPTEDSTTTIELGDTSQSGSTTSN